MKSIYLKNKDIDYLEQSLSVTDVDIPIIHQLKQKLSKIRKINIEYFEEVEND